MLSCEELREAELKMDVSICGLEHRVILGEEISEEDLMNYWDSSKASEDVFARETDEAMKPYIFSHSLCMFAGCAKYDEKYDGTITKENETLEVKSGREFLSKKESVDWLQQEEMKTKGSYGNIQQNIEVGKEGPSDDWSTANEGMESYVRFPSFILVEIVQLYQKIYLQRRELEKQRTYFQGKLLKDTEQGNIFQTHDVEEGLTHSITKE